MSVKKTATVASALPDRLQDGDVSLKKLNFGLWYLQHRRLLRGLLIGFLSLVSVSGWVYSFYGLGRYFIVDQEQDRQSLLKMAKSSVNLLAGRNNQPLDISEVKVFGGNQSDLLAQIHNPNERTVVYFTYSFLVDGQVIVQRDGFVLPGQRRYLVALDQKVPAGADVRLSITQARWQKINVREIADWPTFLANHDQLIVADRQISLALGNGQPVTQIKFRLDNRTAFGYWSVPVVMLAYQGDNLLGINELVLAKLKAGESRSVNFAWPELKSADRLEVIPVVNYLEQNNYLPLEK